MKYSLIFGLVLSVMQAISLNAALENAGATSAVPVIRWLCSTEKFRWQEITVTNVVDVAPETNIALKLDAKTSFQTIDGFGGCFNELGWEALISLPVEKRNEALKALFAPDGANFTLCRAPIGANDFSLGWYSLDEIPGDYAMKHFSIERNRESLIPFIKAAMKYQPKLGIWAIPWCPPSWMTTSGRYCHGRMEMDPQTLSAYALYFSRFVQAWRAEGINLYAVHPQNEPSYNNNIYPVCAWNGEDLNLFLRDYLLPRLKKDRVKVEVWLGTLPVDNVRGYIDPVLGDPKTVPGITGVGFQYNGRKSFLAVHEKYPTMKLAQTETECHNGANTWEEGLTTFHQISEDLTRFANSYFFWNLVLDETAISRANWKQNSLLTVNRPTDTLVYNPEFYAMKHFSAIVLSGARRIATSGGSLKETVAFQNPDGSKVLLFENNTDKTVPVILDVGIKQAQLDVPAKSMNTVILP